MTTAVIFVMLWTMLVSQCLSDDAIFVREYDDVTFDCYVADVMNIWTIEWEITDKSDYRENLDICYLRKWRKPCRQVQNTVMYRNKELHFYTNMTFGNNASCVNQLTIVNVTAALRQTVIECILGVMDNSTSTLMKQKSYPLNVYALPKTAACVASIKNDSDVSIACHILKVYPNVTCQIFVEFLPTMNSSHASYTRGIEMSEPVVYSEYRAAGYMYYNVFCNTKYAPIQPGKYRFHNEIYITKSFKLMSIESNWITVNEQNSEYQKLKMRNKDTRNSQENMGLRNKQDERNRVETSNAFYTLLGAIMLLGLTGIITVLWVIWSRCRKRYASCDVDYGSKGDTYETIESETAICLCEDGLQQGYHNESVDEGVVDIPSNGGGDNGDYSSSHNRPQGTYDNQTIALLRQCITILRSNQDNAYITPCTPELTIRGVVNNNACTPVQVSTNDSTHTPCTPGLTARVSLNNNAEGGASDNDEVSGSDRNIDRDVTSDDRIPDQNICGHVISNNDNYEDGTNGSDTGSVDTTFSSSQTSRVCNDIYVFNTNVSDEIYSFP